MEYPEIEVPVGQLTIFLECGPGMCEHDYSLNEDLYEDGHYCGSSLKCSKCGMLAIHESMWD